MMIILTFCSQIMCQNFSLVESMGAWVAMKVFSPLLRTKVWL
jgi:hypothetical protein